MTIEAVETDLTTEDVPGDELWNLEEFERYKVKLINNGGEGRIIDFEEWKKKHMWEWLNKNSALGEDIPKTLRYGRRRIYNQIFKNQFLILWLN